MNKAKRRDKSCRICDLCNDLRQKAALAIQPPQEIRACHIVSRKAAFWTILDEVDKQEGNIFTDTSSALIIHKLENDPLHSDERFILGLCSEHDALLLKSIRSAVGIS